MKRKCPNCGGTGQVPCGDCGAQIRKPNAGMATKPRRSSRTVRGHVGGVQSAYLNIQTARRDLEWALRYGFDDQRVDAMRSLSDAATQIQAAMRKLTANTSPHGRAVARTVQAGLGSPSAQEENHVHRDL